MKAFILSTILAVNCGGVGGLSKKKLDHDGSLRIEKGGYSLYESESTTLYWDWSINGAEATCHLYGNDEVLLKDIDNSGDFVISPTITTIYKITCISGDTSLTLKSLEIDVTKKPKFLGGITGVNKISELPPVFELLWKVHIKNKDVKCELYEGEELLKSDIKTDGKIEVSPEIDIEYKFLCRGGEEVTESKFFIPYLEDL